jgi:hypothetical protein
MLCSLAMPTMTAGVDAFEPDQVTRHPEAGDPFAARLDRVLGPTWLTRSTMLWVSASSCMEAYFAPARFVAT